MGTKMPHGKHLWRQKSVEKNTSFFFVGSFKKDELICLEKSQKIIRKPQKILSHMFFMEKKGPLILFVKLFVCLFLLLLS